LMGVRVADAVRSLVPATSSSRFTVPNYWADPNSGVSYQIQVQVPQTNMTSMESVKNIPVSGPGGQSVLLRNLAQVSAGTAVGQYERYNMQRMITVTANIAGEDLGSVARKISSAIASVGPPPARVSVALRGQVVPMQQLLDGLRDGLGIAVIVIFLLLLANFQSIRLSLVVIATVPAVVAGVAVMLRLTGTTLNMQSFMGAIMAVGVAVANAILLVTFAERDRRAGGDALAAAIEGASSRLRPIVMTSVAMIAGMIPMALGLGEGGAQSAPLARAVIGGLLAATLSTLVVLPAIFALLLRRAPAKSAALDAEETNSP
jgi:multidrug efflux pump subunit AcrB